MKKKIVFMLQNGIGFGHFKLALTISKYLKDRCEISFITQAKSTEIFDDYEYKVYNFPMLYTLKSNNEILIINKLMNKLIEKINPDLVIEDTYPEDFYLNLPALMNVPKVLLLNRLSSFEFENFYYNGILNQYDKLIILKDKECFINDITSIEVKNYVNYSNKVKYLSGVFNEPTKETENNIIKKYNLDNYDKNIVVSCGAGGWHIGANICEEIFRKMLEITNKLNCKGLNIQTIMVLGPYSKYLEEQFKQDVVDNANIRIVDFETNLDALFHVVDLCVLRPGYNSTMEAISGNSNVLLLPGISYMEDQEIWCRELKENYGVHYINIDNLDYLEEKVLELININTRITNPVINNTKNVADEIYNLINTTIQNQTVRLAFNLQDRSLSKDCVNLFNENKIALVKKNNDGYYLNKTPIINKGDFNLKKYRDYNEVVVYNDKYFECERLSYYNTRYHIVDDGHIVVEYEEIVYSNLKDLFKEINEILNNPQKFNNNIVVNIPVEEKNIRDNIIIPLLNNLKKNNIIIEDLDSYFCDVVNSKISNYKYGYYKPEITKLT